MKKVVLLAIASLFVFSITQAQITKGSVLLGGNIGFGRIKEKTGVESEQNTFTLNPVLGLAIKENLVLGINGFYSHAENTSTNPDIQETTNVGGGFFARRYFPIASKFYLYTQSNISYIRYLTTQKATNTDNRNETKVTTASVGLAPGLAYALSKKFHLELGFNDLVTLSTSTNTLTIIQSGVKSSSKTNSFGLNAGLSTASPLNLGFRFFISK